MGQTKKIYKYHCYTIIEIQGIEYLHNPPFFPLAISPMKRFCIPEQIGLDQVLET